MDPNNPTSVNSALRYWGCTIQAGVQVSGAFGLSSQQPKVEESYERAKKDLSPLPSAFISTPLMISPIDWNRVLLDTTNQDARHLLTSLPSQSSNMTSSVNFDVKRKSVTLFMPGFEKSEIKLYQVCNFLLLVNYLFCNFLYNHILHVLLLTYFMRNKMITILLAIKRNEKHLRSQLIIILRMDFIYSKKDTVDDEKSTLFSLKLLSTSWQINF